MTAAGTRLQRLRLLGAAAAALACLGLPLPLAAQDERRDYPSLLSRAYVELNAGRIDYPFTERHLEPGHRSQSVEIPHLAVRLAMGYRFDEYLSAQLTYLRPVQWVQYRGINGSSDSRSVWMNVTGATLKARVPVGGRWTAYGEAGLGVVTRHGIRMDRAVVLEDAVYVAPLLGGGAAYRLGREWGLGAGVLYSPPQARPAQPRTVAYHGGFTYTIDPQPVPPPAPGAPVYVFPQHLLQAGFTTNALGYGFNTLVSPVFWQGEVRVARGAAVHYQRNIFHTEKLFSLDWGASVSYKQSDLDRNDFLALSIYPLFRFTVVRGATADLYLSYSLAGPTLISKTVIDGRNTGKRFTFQDLMGVGVYAGRNRAFNVELRVGHYSNGNLIPQNPGIKVPLTVNVGYAFSGR